jgi:hypothetical protein
MKRFGSGELQGLIQLYPISSQQKRDRWTVAGRTRQVREIFSTDSEAVRRRNHRWLSTLNYFASNGNGGEYAWDHECRFYFLPRLEEDRPVEAGDSFWEFVEWIVADIRSWGDSERPEEYGQGIYFTPTYLRAKKRPLKRDVKLWLEWGDGTVRALAKSIRDEGRADAYPILADVLEEAGCTYADLLDSCRRGAPDIDGTWVLRILLGDK